MSDKQHILFVDDEPNFLAGIRRSMHRQHDIWNLDFATSADQALRKAEQIDFDAIVLDVRMPAMDGLELLGVLGESEDTKGIPVIILTGNCEHDLKRRALDLGAADLLNKPVNHEDLVARLRSVLRIKSQQDELKSMNQVLDRMVAERTEELEEARFDTIWRLAKAGEYRDDETGNHVVRVGCCCRIIAEEMNMAHDFVESIFLTSSLHDIGKIGVPDAILLKKGRLTPQEWDIMRRHCEIGAKILREQAKGMKPFLKWRGQLPNPSTGKTNDILVMAAMIAMFHHERWDGTGYPKGIHGQDIPLEARIVALVDIYDALRSKRPYKEAYSHEKALEIMQCEADTNRFDPIVYESFETRREEFRQIWQETADGKISGYN